MSETIVTSQGKISGLSCQHCGGHMASANGKPNGRFTMQCDKCGLRVFFWTFPGEGLPLLTIWKSECPADTDFSEYARRRVATHRIEHSENQPVAAPG